VPLAFYSLGLIQYNLKDYNSSLDNFKKIIKDYRDSPYSNDSNLKIAWIYFKQNKFDSVITYLTNTGVNNFPSEQKSEGYNLLGWAKFRLKSYKEAIQNFQISIDSTQDSTKILEGMLYISKSYYNLVDYQNSIKSYEAFINRAQNLGIADDIPSALSDMAWSYMKLGDRDKGAEIYQKLVRDYPQSGFTSDALFKLAEYFYNLSDYKAAIDFYQEIIDLSQDSDLAASSLYWMAWSYVNVNDMANGIQNFEKYVQVYPKGDYASDSLWRIASIYYDLGNFEKAKTYYNKLLSSYPNSPDAQRAKIQLSDIQLKEASGGDEEKLYQLLLKQSNTSEAKASVMSKLASYYQKNEMPDDALKLYNEIIKISQGEEAALATYEIAENYRTNGNYVEAIKMYGNIFYVYKFADIYPQALYGLSYCYYKAGDNDTANKYIDRLIERYPDNDWSSKAKELKTEINSIVK
jgi:TolA-binding protein